MARILIVDDDVLDREFLSTLLGYGGHELSEAGDGEDGLYQATTLRPHLIITDGLMPNMDGAEFVARLRADPALANIPIIFFTAASGEREAQIMARACGVRWVICMPSDPQRILDTVQDALAEGQLIGEEAPVGESSGRALAGQPAGGRSQAGVPVVSARAHGHDRPGPRAMYSVNPLQEFLLQTVSSAAVMSHFLENGDAPERAQEQLKDMSQRLSQSVSTLQSISLRLTALVDLGIELAAERDPEELLHMACRVAHKMCLCNRAAIGIVDASGEHLRHYVERGNDSARHVAPPGARQGILAMVLDQRQAVRLAGQVGVDHQAGMSQEATPGRPFLGVAIASPAHVYGWLVMTGNADARSISEVDERIAMTIAAQLAVAWENLVLYQEIALSRDRLQQEAAQRRAIDEDLRRFRLAMDTTADAIMLIDPSNVSFVDFNATTCALFGYSEKELREVGPIGLGAGTRDQLRSVYTSLMQGDDQHASVELALQRKDGSAIKVEVHRRALRSGDGWIIVAVARDLTEREAERKRVQQLAHYDTLTGLANRTLFAQSLQRALEQAAQAADAVVVLLLDIDRFQKINDTLGHAGGDELLRQVADRLLGTLLARDTVGRLGADEFGIILRIPDRQHQEKVVLDRIRRTLSPRFTIDGSHITVTASIGISLYPDDADNAETLLKYANTAMHWTKEGGRNGWRYFTAEMNRHALERLELENAMRTAIEQQQFVLLFQPKVNISSGLVCGAEVLLRWKRPGFGLVSPAEFIPLLEETGLVVPVGAWVLDETCRVLRQWQDAGRPPLQLSVNVSARQFFDAELEPVMLDALRRHGVSPTLLMLEITESSLMADVEQATAVLNNLKRLGLQVALDDFGTGYSSLAYLRRFPIDTLKIDISFIRDLLTSTEDAAIVSTVINMAHLLKLGVVAEGVENAGQLRYLRDHGCDEIQGFWYHRPLAEVAFRGLVDRKVRLRFE